MNILERRILRLERLILESESPEEGIFSDNLEDVKEAAKDLGDLDHVNGEIPLEHAIRLGKKGLPIVKFLLDKGARCKLYSSEGILLPFLAIQLGNIEALKLMAKSDSQLIYCTNSVGMTVVQALVAKNILDWELISDLLRPENLRRYHDPVGMINNFQRMYYQSKLSAKDYSKLCDLFAKSSLTSVTSTVLRTIFSKALQELNLEGTTYLLDAYIKNKFYVMSGEYDYTRLDKDAKEIAFNKLLEVNGSFTIFNKGWYLETLNILREELGKTFSEIDAAIDESFIQLLTNDSEAYSILFNAVLEKNIPLLRKLDKWGEFLVDNVDLTFDEVKKVNKALTKDAYPYVVRIFKRFEPRLDRATLRQFIDSGSKKLITLAIDLGYGNILRSEAMQLPFKDKTRQFVLDSTEDAQQNTQTYKPELTYKRDIKNLFNAIEMDDPRTAINILRNTPPLADIKKVRDFINHSNNDHSIAARQLRRMLQQTTSEPEEQDSYDM